jgi:AraC-like DNA-binding protein
MPRHQLGYCAHCGQWLGDSSNQSEPTTDFGAELSGDERDTEAVGELLALSGSVGSTPNLTNFEQGLMFIINEIAEGNVRATARLAGVSYTSLDNFIKRNLRLTMQNALSFSRLLRESLFSMLTQHTAVMLEQIKANLTGLHVIINPIKKPARSDVEAIRNQVLTILADNASPLTIDEIAMQVGYSSTTLRKLLPEVMDIIRKWPRGCISVQTSNSHTGQRIDVDVMRRKVKLVLDNNDSQRLSYAEVCRRAGYGSRTVRKYAPDIHEQILERNRTYRQSSASAKDINQRNPPKSRVGKRLDVHHIRTELEAQLHNTAEPPLSVAEVARVLGVTDKTLRKHWPELCFALADRRRAYRSLNYKQRIEKLEQTVQALQNQGIYPSRNKVRKALGPYFLREARISDFYIHLMTELGYRK